MFTRLPSTGSYRTKVSFISVGFIHTTTRYQMTVVFPQEIARKALAAFALPECELWITQIVKLI